MPKKRDILSVLSRKQLLDTANQLGFLGWSVLTKNEIVNKLSRKRSIPAVEILNPLKINELRHICIGLNLNPGGLKKQTIIDRIPGKGNETKPKQTKPVKLSKKNKTALKQPAKPKLIAKPKQIKKKEQ